MSRYIKANELEESIRKLRRCLQLMDNSKRADIVMQGISLAEIEIQKTPTADVVEVVHGEWKDGDCRCPVCGEDKFKGLDADIWSDWKPKYCPHCGAKMERGEDE